MQKARQLGESDEKNSKRNASVSQVFLNASVYDGRHRIGSVVQISDRTFAALNMDGADLGRFGTLKAASRAIPGGAA